MLLYAASSRPILPSIQKPRVLPLLHARHPGNTDPTAADLIIPEIISIIAYTEDTLYFVCKLQIYTRNSHLGRQLTDLRIRNRQLVPGFLITTHLTRGSVYFEFEAWIHAAVEFV